jgi:hypothetical protein
MYAVSNNFEGAVFRIAYPFWKPKPFPGFQLRKMLDIEREKISMEFQRQKENTFTPNKFLGKQN